MYKNLLFSIGLLFLLGLNSNLFQNSNLQNHNQRPAASYYKGGMAVYEKFDQIEPLFHLENDTTYIINFWATWCKPCVKELPYFEEYTKKHSNDKSKVILLSLDFPKQIESKLIPFVYKHDLQSEVNILLDGKFNKWIDRVSTEWSGVIPITYIYKKDNVKFIGEPIESLQELEKFVDSI